MKQILRFSLMSALFLLCGSSYAATDVKFDFDANGTDLFGLPGESSNDVSDGDFTEAKTATIDGVSVTVSAAAEGITNANRIWNKSPKLRMYSGTLTIVAPNGHKITAIAFNQGKWNNGNTADKGTLSSAGWSGSETSVVITIAGNTQIKDITVTLDGESSGEESGDDTNYGTADAPLTVAEAVAIANALDQDATTSKDVYTKGVVTEITTAWSSQYNNVSFNISDYGGTTVLAVFRCKSEAEDYVLKDDEVIIKGKLKNFRGNTPEYDEGCEIVSLIQGGGHSGGNEGVHIANTAETAYTVAKAIELIDAGEALTEEVYVKGKISQIEKFNSDGSITYWISDDGSTTNQFECYKGKGLEGADFTSIEDLKKGSTVIVKGKLTKYNSTYEFNAGNILVSYDESTAVEEKHIANTAETAYTVAEAYELIDAGESLQETVYVKGIISKVETYKEKYKSIDYWISDDGTTESKQFECYSGKGINGADFESIEDLAVGATVIVKGTIKKYNGTYEFNQSNELVSYEYAADTWTVAGTYPLVDNSWDPSDASADMTSTDGVNFTYVKEGIVLEKGAEYKFKVVKNHSWDEAYPSSDYIVTVRQTAIYKVTITFNASTKEISVENVITGSASDIEHTYGLVGTLVGSWDNDVEMKKDAAGLYRAVVNNVARGDYEFKVRADKAWDICYPSSNYMLTVEQDGSTVTVIFNEETKEVNAIVDSAPVVSYDLTGDGTIDVFDVLAVIGLMATAPDGAQGGDFTGDGVVDVFDVLAVIAKMAEQ